MMCGTVDSMSRNLREILKFCLNRTPEGGKEEIAPQETWTQSSCDSSVFWFNSFEGYFFQIQASNELLNIQVQVHFRGKIYISIL